MLRSKAKKFAGSSDKLREKMYNVDVVVDDFQRPWEIPVMMAEQYRKVQ